MCIEALAQAFRCDLKPSSLKFVLVALADCANERQGMKLWPSVAHLCEITSQDRKTVLASVAELIRMGYLADTGEKMGTTQQIKVYKLTIPETAPLKSTDSVQTFADVHQCPTVPETAPLQEESRFSVKESRFSVKESRKRDTEPLEPLEPLNNTIGARDADQPPQEEKTDAQPATKSKPKSASRGCAIPVDWQPNANHREKCTRLGLNADALHEEFRYHHTARGTIFKNWDAGFFTWIGNAAKFGARQGSPAGNNRPQSGGIFDAGMRVANRYQG